MLSVTSPIYRTHYISGLWAKFLAVETLSFPASPMMARDYQPVLGPGILRQRP